MKARYITQHHTDPRSIPQHHAAPCITMDPTHPSPLLSLPASISTLLSFPDSNGFIEWIFVLLLSDRYLWCILLLFFSSSFFSVPFKFDGEQKTMLNAARTLHNATILKRTRLALTKICPWCCQLCCWQVNCFVFFLFSSSLFVL